MTDRTKTSKTDTKTVLNKPWTLKDKIMYVLWWPYRFWTLQIVYIPREVKWHWQRAFRGWADCDVWNMDNYLSRLIEEMAAHLADHHIGHPADMTDERWTNRLRFISRSFRDYRKWQEEAFFRDDPESDEYKIKENLIQENWDRAWEVFHKRYDSLWD